MERYFSKLAEPECLGWAIPPSFLFIFSLPLLACNEDDD